MTLTAVADTGPFIHLSEIDSLSLLSLFDRLSVPATVRDELQRGGTPESLSKLAFDVVAVDGRHDAQQLDPGEAAALAAASARDAVLLTDDLAAREAAQRADVEVHGTVGVIALGYARDRLGREEAAALMRDLQDETSLFVTDAVVERGIELLDER